MNTVDKKRKSLKQALTYIQPSLTELYWVILMFITSILSIATANLALLFKHALILLLSIVLARFCHLWRSQGVYRLIPIEERWFLVKSKEYSGPIEDALRITQCHYWSRWCIVLKHQRFAEQTQYSRWHCFLTTRYKIVFRDACSPDGFHHLKLVARYCIE